METVGGKNQDFAGNNGGGLSHPPVSPPPDP
jgi:hypothetical protein